MKTVLNLIGIIAVALGILGIFLPLLPTTPFLLLASACFARGSTRLHNWLRTNPVFGKYLRDYEDGRGLPVRGKVVILLLMWGSLGYSMAKTGKPLLIAMLALIGTGVTVFLLRYVPTMRSRSSE
ncbi:YbaN family protein [Pseudoduganella rhizocola]|uniref:YbaN family protein n=1 Tax=Pseudoduganella rhizocola TaxID=3382643 RepID=UPI0038B5526E